MVHFIEDSKKVMKNLARDKIFSALTLQKKNNQMSKTLLRVNKGGWVSNL